MGYLLIAIVIAFSAVAFALGNHTPVVVSFLFWKQESSLALLLLITFTLGVLSSLIAIFPTVIRKSKTARRYRLAHEAAERALAESREKKEVLTVRPSVDPTTESVAKQLEQADQAADTSE